MHRLAFIALVISVLLAFALSLVRHVGSVDDDHVITYYSARPETPIPTPHFRRSIQMHSVRHRATPIYDPEISTRPNKHTHSKHKSHHESPHETATATLSPDTSIASPKLPNNSEDDLIKTETSLQVLPHTLWYYNRHLNDFRPPAYRASNIRLISLNDACYCTHRNKFILPREHPHQKEKKHKSKRFPAFVFRYGAARSAQWTSPRYLAAFAEQKAVFVPGTAVFWRGRILHTSRDHLHRALVPMRSVIDLVKKTSLRPDIHVVTETFESIENNNTDIAKLYDYYLGDVATNKRISLKRIRPRLICFRRVIALGSEYENHASSARVYDHVKDLVETAERGRLAAPLIKACRDPGANTDAIWVVHRQAARTSFGSLENLAQVETAVNHELLRHDLADKVSMRVGQAPNSPCPPGTAREGCYDFACGDARPADSDCIRSSSTLREVQLFNNMTFLITTSGPANEAFAYMPRGSHVIELVPYGFFDSTYEHAARDAHLVYHRVQGKASQSTQPEFFQRFGDIASSPKACWADIECRAARLSRETYVDIHHLRAVLQKAISKWRSVCADDPYEGKKNYFKHVESPGQI